MPVCSLDVKKIRLSYFQIHSCWQNLDTITVPPIIPRQHKDSIYIGFKLIISNSIDGNIFQTLNSKLFIKFFNSSMSGRSIRTPDSFPSWKWESSIFQMIPLSNCDSISICKSFPISIRLND